MDITGREVARLLGLGRETANRVLAAGLAGPAHSRAGAHLYARDRVLALRDRSVVDEATPLPPGCEHGVLIARINPRGRPGDPMELAPGPWRLAAGRAAVLTVLVAQQTLQLDQPGEWYAAFDGRRLPSPPGDPLLFWRCRLCPQLPRGRPRST